MSILFLLVPTLALTAPVPEVDAEKTAKAFVEKRKADQGELKSLKSDVLARVFPEQTFFTLRFRQWPVAIAPAEGFQSSNLVLVPAKGEPSLFTSGMQLSKIISPLVARDEKGREQVVRAMLLLESELLQDGFYKFQLVEESLTTKGDGDKRIVSGKMIAQEGGNGEITASVTFDADGKVAGTSLNHSLVRGPRPRCQATLLLHPDPEVRQVCERNLLQIGLAAREYMQEQRAKAAPLLQVEIDRVWRKIEAAGH